MLYHGSQTKKELLEPQQAYGHGQEDNHFAVYATSDLRIAQLFAIEYRALRDDAYFKIVQENGEYYVMLHQTAVNWDKKGYVHYCHLDSFIQIEPLQWISTQSVIPDQIEQVDPLDFTRYIRTDD